MRGALDECSFQDLLMPGFRLRVSAHGGVDGRWVAMSRRLDVFHLVADAADFESPSRLREEQRPLETLDALRRRVHSRRGRCTHCSLALGGASAQLQSATLKAFGDVDVAWFHL